jgi:predicted nucleotidyltransferase
MLGWVVLVIGQVRRVSWIRIPRHGSTRLRVSIASWYIEPLARLLGSRHIPGTVREQYPRIPWQRVADLAAYLVRIRSGAWPPAGDFDLIRDFNRRYAPRLMREFTKMRAAMAGSKIDGNQRDGILAQHKSGRFVHVTVRIPEEALDGLWPFLNAAYEDEIVPTTAYVEGALRKISRRLRALGLTAIFVYGSVARGAASAASDVDLAYRLRGEIDADRWMAIKRLLETALGKVVDAHRIQRDERPPKPAHRVWRA